MITIRVNNRDLSIRFCYSKRYALDVPDPTRKDRLVAHLATVPKAEHTAAKRAFNNREPKFMRVVRPLTQCYLEEKIDGKWVTLAKTELKLYFRDEAWAKRSEQGEALRKWLIAKTLKQSDLDKTTRKCLWISFLTRHTVKPNVVVPPDESGPAPVAQPRIIGRPIEVIDVPKSDYTIIPVPDTIPEERRIIAVGHRVTSTSTRTLAEEVDTWAREDAGGHRVVNKVVPIRRPWHYSVPMSPMVH